MEMSKELVTVQSVNINNESVPIVFQTSSVLQGDEQDVREISRSYVFIDHKTVMPLAMARILIKQQPNEFFMVGAEEKADEVTKKAVKVSLEKAAGFKCEFCGAEAKSKAGLSCHIRYTHPDKWAGKPTKPRYKANKVK